MKKSVLLAVCAASAFTLNSCAVFWNTGERIACKTAVCKGFDTLHPVDGKVYVGPKGMKFYMLAPEVTYYAQPPIVGELTSKETAVNVTPTGRTAWIWVTPTTVYFARFKEVDEKTGLMKIPTADSRWKFVKEIGSLPKEAKLWNTGEVFDETPEPRLLGLTECPQPSTTAKVLTAPLTYVVDPALTVVTSTVGAAGKICCSCAAIAAGVTVVAGAAVLSLPGNLISGVLGQPQHVTVSVNLSSYPRDVNFIRAVPRGQSYVYEYRQADVNGDGGTVIAPHLPAPYLRKMVDGKEPLALFISYDLPRHRSDAEIMAIRAKALQPLLEQGLNIRTLNLRPVDNSYDIAGPDPSRKEIRNKRAELSL